MPALRRSLRYPPRNEVAQRVPVSEARVALVVTAGAYLTDEQAPFKLAVDGDPDFREIPGGVELSRLGLSHVGYDTRRALQDPNVIFPLGRLREAG
jgi:D-proline reductase (dithiol) PrdB